MIEILREKYIGRLVGAQPKNEAEHFYQCEACGAWVDRRDLGQVFDHEGPLPGAENQNMIARDCNWPAQS